MHRTQENKGKNTQKESKKKVIQCITNKYRTLFKRNNRKANQMRT